MQKITANELAREILKGDKQEIKERLITLRRDESVADQDFFEAFALVTLNMLGPGQTEPANRIANNAKINDDLLAGVEAYLNRHEICYRRHESAIEIGVKGDYCNFKIFILVTPETKHVIFDIPGILKVPIANELSAARLICILNAARILGCFHYDHENNEVSFRIILPFRNEAILTDHQISACIAVCCDVMDKYVKEIAKVCWES